MQGPEKGIKLVNLGFGQHEAHKPQSESDWLHLAGFAKADS